MIIQHAKLDSGFSTSVDHLAYKIERMVEEKIR